MQKTLETQIEINGIGLHSGKEAKMRIKPAPVDSGISFVRSDLPSKNSFPARYDHVVDTRNCTCLGDNKGQIVSTIEHVMAALYAAGVDNAVIEVNGPEVPIMDGSAEPFIESLKKIQIIDQNAKRKYLKVLKTISFDDGKGAQMTLSPSDQFVIRAVIDFPSQIVGHQEFETTVEPEKFESMIAPARTFCEKYQVDYLRSVGLIKGGSLDNAVVLDGENILNEGGFRFENECVKHKMLDCIGDMFTSGYRMIARIDAVHTGHFHNNEVLKKLFSDINNYVLTGE